MRSVSPLKRGPEKVVRLPEANSEKRAGELIYLTHTVLYTHPKNLRRFYPDADVRDMAGSIRKRKGVYQALLIVPKNDEPGRYYVVDGNVRLAGARLLGSDCPKLKCEVIPADEADQLLAMAVTAKFRYEPDAISEALHYRRLQDEEGFTVQRIVDETGINRVKIDNRLKLLDLDLEIQELVATRKLPCDVRAADAFLSVSNRKARVKLAQRLAHDGATIKTILAACQRLSCRLQEAARVDLEGAPSLVLGQQGSFQKRIPSSATTKWSKVRSAAREMCAKCDAKLASMDRLPEPAWTLITHAAEGTCCGCKVKEVAQACGQCPAVDIMRRLAVAAGARQK